MSELSHRLFVKSSIIHLIFLIWQLAFNLKCGSARAILPDTEVSALSTFADLFKSKVVQLSVSPDFCETVSNYDYSITCNCAYENGSTCHITELRLGNKDLTGTINDAVGDLSYLVTIVLSDNELQGSIPSSLGKLVRLENLDLSNNQLRGQIPDSLGNLINLQWLYLQNNFLDGFIPSTLGRLVSLKEMNLDFNMLWGSIPHDFGKLGNLTSLRVNENRLYGTLPATLGNMSSLEVLSLQSNSLTGELPESYGNLAKMRRFGVAGSKLSGRLPTFVKNWTNVITLILQGNNFEGPIPEEYFNLSKLRYLFISDLSNSSPIQLPKSANIPYMYSLVLRNCSINGSIPKYISELSSLKFLDLSFNNLTGTVPESWESSLIYMSFARNNLTGKIPFWIFDQATRTRTDLSYNNFSEIEVPVPKNNDELNLFACCGCQNSASPNIKPFMLKPAQMMEAYFPKNKQKFYSLFINCGGEETTMNGDRYDADNYTSRFHVSSMRNWAYSFSGDFLAKTVESTTAYTRRLPSKISNTDYVSVYDEVRLSPVSLDYYGLSLHNGTYEVTLYFAEIIYPQDVADYNSLRKRMFDVYIQGKRELTDFNIRDQADGPNSAVNRTFKNVTVHNRLLHIQFYWAGKGSYTHLRYSDGPIISAISVKPEFEVPGPSLLKNASISGASVLVALLLLLALAWRMGWLEKKEWQATIVVGKNKTVTLKELIKTTGNFSKKNKMGKGSLGIVYVAEPKDGKFKVAVKRLSSKFTDKMDELKAQTFNMKSMEHDNLIKLWDVHIGEVAKLLVYEFMEENSLENALFDRSKPALAWETRLDICLGIAKGLKYLHEYPQGSIVHGNIKAANILLHGKGGVKLSDFGLVRVYDEKELLHKAAKEASKGFNPVEYFQGEISTKSDVYSYGMILLVIVSGRKTEVDRISTEETEFLLNTAYELKMKSRLIELVDKRLDGKYNPKEALIILELALLCTHSGPVERPTISEALRVLKNPNKPLSEIIRRDRNASHIKRDKGVIVHGELEEKLTADPA